MLGSLRTFMHRRLKQAAPTNETSEITRPTYERYRIESALVGYVVGEGHHDKSVPELTEWFSSEHGGGNAEIERGLLASIIGGMLGIEGGKVVPFTMEKHIAQWAVLNHVVREDHHDKTVSELAQELAPDGPDSSVKRAVRDLVSVGLLETVEGRVVPADSFQMRVREH